MTRSLDERLLEATTGTLELFGVYLGARLGLYTALVNRGRLTSRELAEAAGIHPRYAREWCEQQAVAGFLAVDDPARPAEARRYRLPADHAAVLADPLAAEHVAPFADMVVGIAGVLDAVADAYRTGGGVPYSHYGAAFRRGQGSINRPAFSADLVDSWLPAIPGLVELLRVPGVRIADVGCGHGWSTIAVAQAFRGAEVLGLDTDAASVRDAQEHAAAVCSSARFVLGDAVTLIELAPFDVVMLLECLHDLAQPIEALAAARAALTPGGSVIVVDENVASTFTAPGDLTERLMYGWSISHCLPAVMAERPSAALGTVLRESAVGKLAAEAGFASTDVVDVDAGFFRVYHLRGAR